jgi:hypothetical protein
VEDSELIDVCNVLDDHDHTLYRVTFGRSPVYPFIKWPPIDPDSLLGSAQGTTLCVEKAPGVWEAKFLESGNSLNNLCTEFHGNK